jgi:hypothetical protein
MPVAEVVGLIAPVGGVLAARRGTVASTTDPPGPLAVSRSGVASVTVSAGAGRRALPTPPGPLIVDTPFGVSSAAPPGSLLKVRE